MRCVIVSLNQYDDDDDDDGPLYLGYWLILLAIATSTRRAVAYQPQMCELSKQNLKGLQTRFYKRNNKNVLNVDYCCFKYTGHAHNILYSLSRKARCIHSVG